MKDYYHILGLNRSASSRQIRKRTIIVGKKLHPQTSESAAVDQPTNFIDVVEASDVLYEEDTRKVYDLLLDCANGTKKLGQEVHDKYVVYMEIKSRNGRENGAYYASQKFKEFKDVYRAMNWWNVITMIPWP